MKLLFDREHFGDRLRYSPQPYTPVRSLRHQDALKKPIVVWNITTSCNLNCHYCYLDAAEAPETTQLNEREAKKLILSLSEFKVPALLFSGGEPLLRKDIFELGKFAKECGIRPVLSSNGTLITALLAKEIKLAGFEYIGISIDGRKATHDRIRFKNGAFDSAVRGIRNCQQAGIKTGLRFTLTKGNFKDLDFIFDFVKQERLKRLCIYHLVYSGRAKTRIAEDLTRDEKREVLDFIWKKVEIFYREGLDIEVLTVGNHADGVWLYQRLRRINPERAKEVFKLLEINGGNGSGQTIAAVDHLGNVFPDQFWRTRNLGNIYKKTFSQIWQDESDSLLSALRRRNDFIKGRCQRCNYFSLCNGNMRARAEAVFGDIWAEDPACYLSDGEIYQDDGEYSATNCLGANL